MGAIAVHVLGVSADAEAVVEQLADAGHTVSGPQVVGLAEVAAAIAGAPGAEVVVVVGACDASSGLPQAVESTCTRVLPGVGELARRVASELGREDAVFLQALGGLTSNGAVFLVPDDAEVARATLDGLLPGLHRFADGSEHPVVAARSETATSPRDAADDVQVPAGPAPRTTSVGLGTALEGGGTAPVEADEELPNRGWKRAVHDLKATVHLDRREELPDPIEKLAPVVNVLHTAGEVGMMKLPSGRRYGLYGWPDLRRSNAKVLAISWGEPLAEVVALHRYPNRAGTCIPGKLGILPSQDRNVDALCEEIVGSAPLKPEGKPFAIDEKEVWLLRERRVIKWDGRRERDDGSPKQVLASLALSWSNR